MLFSVITVCFNSAHTIASTLSSVAEQDFADYEHIIVDGASTDDTVDVVRLHSSPKLRWLSEPDNGLYDAMNKGLRLAKGEYVLYLNSDDFLARRDALSLVAARLREVRRDCLFAETSFIKADGVTPANRHYSTRNFRPWWVRLGIMPPHPSMFVRRELLLQLGGFDTSYRIGADFDLIARALLREGATWATLPIVTTKFRVGSISTAGLSPKITLSYECARSLRALGQPLAFAAVLLRFPIKILTQVLARGAITSAPNANG